MKSNEGKNCSKIPLHRKIFTQHDNNQLYGNIYVILLYKEVPYIYNQEVYRNFAIKIK